MPEHLRALAVILVLATAVFALAKGPALAGGTAETDFKLRRNAWFAVTLAAFLAHNFWLFIAVAGALLVLVASKEANRLALLFTVLFAVPAIAVDIPGLAGVRVVFSMDWIRLLALAVLLPAFVASATNAGSSTASANRRIQSMEKTTRTPARPGISTAIAGTANSTVKRSASRFASFDATRTSNAPATAMKSQKLCARKAARVTANQALRRSLKSVSAVPPASAGPLASANTAVARTRMTARARRCSGMR